MSKQEANPNFYCPITQELMRDPVVDRDGNSYERSAIMNWLQNHDESPITRNAMFASDLVPNRSLRASIDDYLHAAVQFSASPAKAESKATEEKEERNEPVAVFKSPRISLIGGNAALDRSTEHTYMLSVESDNPPSLQRHPATIVCVVDTSGSMCAEAKVQGVESRGLSMLDIVKHAVRTTITTLGDNDRFGLVKFSTTGSIVCDLMYMTAAGKALALSNVDELKTGGSTNLWDGLKLGMDLLVGAGESAGNSALFLLTDGIPSEIPPRGHIPMMQRYRDSHGGKYPGTINTFGFGYLLDSSLLSDIAIEGGGMYAFIPDSGFVGTAFVNALGNHLSSYGKHCVLSVEVEGGRIEEKWAVMGGPEYTVSSWGVAFKIPSLLAGTSQHFVFTVSDDGPELARLNMSLTYEHLVSAPGNPVTVSTESCTIEMPPENRYVFTESVGAPPEVIFRSMEYELQCIRLSVVDTLRQINVDLQEKGSVTPRPGHSAALSCDVASCDKLLTQIRTVAIARAHPSEVKNLSSRVSGLKEDINGQITEAISKREWYDKWGKHYLLSLQRAHLLMQCNNFKDPGLQHYGGNLFQHYRDKADDVFMSLPPPSPSRAVITQSGTTRAPAAPINMAAYNDVSGGCVHESSMVHMADGSRRRISELQKGDRVYSQYKNGVESQTVEVVCMVRTVCEEGAANLVTLKSGLRITPWHPVRDESGQWRFPSSLCDNKPMESVPGSYVYTFVVADKDGTRGAGMIVDYTECISLGHGIENDDVASHSFFGTSQVISGLQRCEGWSNGLVTLHQKDFARDSATGQIAGLCCEV